MNSEQLNITPTKNKMKYKIGEKFNITNELNLPLVSLRRFCMNFDGSNSITEKYNINVTGSSKNVVNESSTESESSIEHDSTTVNENSLESNDGTEKDSSKTSKSIENIVLLRCRRPKSVRVKMRLELPRKHPKSVMLRKAKNHGVSNVIVFFSQKILILKLKYQI